MLIFLYFLYFVVSIFFLAFKQGFNIGGFNADLGLVLIQGLFYALIAYLWIKKADFKKLKEDVIGTFSLPITERPTHMKIQSWILILLIFLFSFTTYVDGTVLFYIASIMDYALMILFAHPIFVEANVALKQKGIGKIILYAVLGFVVSFGLDFIVAFIQSLFVNVPSEAINQIMVEEMVHAAPLKMFLDVVFTAAITEEIVFRGLSFRTLLHRNKFLAYFTTFMIFGIIHLIPGFMENGLIELVFLPAYGGMGFIMAYVYHKSESIYTPMLIHFFNNLLGFVTILFL